MLKCKINYFCKVIIEILKKLFTTSFCLFALWASAQTGTKVYPFLNVPVSARQAVLGGDAVSVRCGAGVGVPDVEIGLGVKPVDGHGGGLYPVGAGIAHEPNH